MTAPGLAGEEERFRLKPGRGEIALHAGGLRYGVRRSFSRRDVFIPYAEITHLASGARALRIAARRSVYVTPRISFAEPGDAERLLRAILTRIAREPGGEAQLARISQVEQLSRTPTPLRACSVVALLCIVIYVCELFLGNSLHFAGLFGTTLVRLGEVWRLVTGNLLHANLLHLVLNVMGLIGIGALVERPLGSTVTIFVLGVSAFGAMGAGALWGYEFVVGASGLVSGLAGAALWLELRAPERLPATWRIPRRLFVFALLGDGLLSALAPMIAGVVHLGGFVAGYAAAALLAPAALRREPLPGALRLADALFVVVMIASLGAAGVESLHGSRILALRAERLLEDPNAPAMLLNDTAWLLVTTEARTSDQIEVAVRLAERAVTETERRDPNVLDTLAEAQFAAGERAAALDTIDEAIALAPNEPYFQEQRRRFTGERASDDRPEPPGEPAPPEPPREFPRRLPPGHPGIGEKSPGLEI